MIGMRKQHFLGSHLGCYNLKISLVSVFIKLLLGVREAGAAAEVAEGEGLLFLFLFFFGRAVGLVRLGCVSGVFWEASRVAVT